MASVASQLIEEVTAHAQSDSLEDAREICADDTYFPNNLLTIKADHRTVMMNQNCCPLEGDKIHGNNVSCVLFQFVLLFRFQISYLTVVPTEFLPRPSAVFSRHKNHSVAFVQLKTTYRSTVQHCIVVKTNICELRIEFPSFYNRCCINRIFWCFPVRLFYFKLLTYLFTYLLTYFMGQSPSWEANRFCS